MENLTQQALASEKIIEGLKVKIIATLNEERKFKESNKNNADRIAYLGLQSLGDEDNEELLKQKAIRSSNIYFLEDSATLLKQLELQEQHETAKLKIIKDNINIEEYNVLVHARRNLDVEVEVATNNLLAKLEQFQEENNTQHNLGRRLGLGFPNHTNSILNRYLSFKFKPWIDDIMRVSSHVELSKADSMLGEIPLKEVL